MSNGELKKQVNELHFMLNVTSEHDIRQIREVFKSIIDEAKKEFPTEKQEVEKFAEEVNNRHLTPEDAVPISLRANYARLQWFKKWFGEEEKSEE